MKELPPPTPIGTVVKFGSATFTVHGFRSYYDKQLGRQRDYFLLDKENTVLLCSEGDFEVVDHER